MNFIDDSRAADRALDHRLYAAAKALREGSTTEVDATTALRVIHLHADPVPQEPDPQPAPSPNSPATSPFRGSQRRLALGAQDVAAGGPACAGPGLRNAFDLNNAGAGEVGLAPITAATSVDSIGSSLWAIAAYISASRIYICNGKEGVLWQARYSTS